MVTKCVDYWQVTRRLRVGCAQAACQKNTTQASRSSCQMTSTARQLRQPPTIKAIERVPYFADAKSYWFYYCSKGLVVVNTVLLQISLNNLFSLIAEDLAILSLFNFKHLFTSERLIRRLKGGKVNKFPRLVLNQRPYLLYYCFYPFFAVQAVNFLVIRIRLIFVN